MDVPSRLVLIRESVKTTKVKGQPPARQTVAMSVAPEVAVTRGATRVKLEDLKAKDHVTARYVPAPDGAKALSFRVADARPLGPLPSTDPPRQPGTDPPYTPGMAHSKAPDAPFARQDGTRARTADLLADAGGLPLLLAFFKTSCPTCRLAWPYLQRLHAAYGEKAVHVVGVSQNTAKESREFFEEFGKATFNLVLDPEAHFEASNAFHVEAVPHLALISPAASSKRRSRAGRRRRWRRSARGSRMPESSRAFQSSRPATPSRTSRPGDSAETHTDRSGQSATRKRRRLVRSPEETP